MREPFYQSIIFGTLVACLPWAATMPSIGGFIARRSNRLPGLVGGVFMGIIGLWLLMAGIISPKAGYAFFAPLWQIALIQLAYSAWYKFHKKPPVLVCHNWNEGLFWDRAMAMFILLPGILVPALFIIRYTR